MPADPAFKCEIEVIRTNLCRLLDEIAAVAETEERDTEYCRRVQTLLKELEDLHKILSRT